MFTDFIKPDNSSWSKILQQTSHDFYHLPEYVEFAARHEGGQACAFVAETEGQALLIPLIQKTLPPQLEPTSGLCDLLAPYGYGGPLLIGNPSPEALSAMLRGFLRAAREKGAVSAFWRLHPLLPFPLDPLEKIGTLVSHGRTVYIDLNRSPEQLWRETTKSHRQHIKRLRGKGFIAVRNDWRYWPSFFTAYQETMNRTKANKFYCFSSLYFEELKAALGKSIDLWTVLSPTGKVAASALFTTANGIVQYHLGATFNKFLDCSPNKLMVDEARLWARKAGYHFLHLGGGVGGTMDSLYTFKARFSPLSAPFHTFRTVLQPTVYADLTTKRFGNRSTPQGGSDDYFPAYRAPLQ